MPSSTTQKGQPSLHGQISWARGTFDRSRENHTFLSLKLHTEERVFDAFVGRQKGKSFLAQYIDTAIEKRSEHGSYESLGTPGPGTVSDIGTVASFTRVKTPAPFVKPEDFIKRPSPAAEPIR